MGLFSREFRKDETGREAPPSPPLQMRKAEIEVLLEDLAAGAKFQQALLPQTVPAVPGYDFAAVYRPARALSGDFYDLLPTGDGRLAVVIADVSGKSIQAALMAVMCHLLVRTRPDPEAAPAKVLSHVNRLLLGNIRRGSFISGMYAVLDPSRHTLTLANAGHLPAVLWHARQKLATTHRPQGGVLGVVPPEVYERGMVEEVLALAPGDRFLLITDGVNEAMAPGQKEFGMEHLRQRLKNESDAPSSVFLRSVTDQIELHRGGGEQSDDITIVTGRRLP